MKKELTTKLSKEQKKHIGSVVDRYIKMQRNRKIKALKEWLKLHKN